MKEVSPFRLWMMRAMYLVMAVGLGLNIWPLIISHRADLPHMSGVAFALLGTIGLLALLGIRYPLRMIPLLLFELIWKAVWLSAFALPRWLDGTISEAMRTSVFETSLGAVLFLVIPWRYVYDHYVAATGDPWNLRLTSRAESRRMGGT
jgi:hypothetical protein